MSSTHEIHHTDTLNSNKAEEAAPYSIRTEEADDMTSENFDVFDDDGNVVNPAAEGSFLMAEGLAEVIADDEGPLVFEPYVPDFDVAARQAETEAFFSQNRARIVAAATNSCAVDAEAMLCVARLDDATPQDEDEDACEEGEADEAGACESMGSRDMTDPDDWVLEALLRRRMNKEREGGPWVYLCKWKRHEEPTWETREVMEEAGWIPQLNAFDLKGVHSKGPNMPHAKKDGVRFSAAQCAVRIESFFGSNDAAIAQRVTSAGSNFHIYHYSRVNISQAKQFLQRWETLKKTHCPALVFHGTRAANLRSIATIGLVAGGTRGMKVHNGTVHGSGVYTAKTPTIPIFYSDISNALIVAVGLVPIGLPINGDESASAYRWGTDYVIFRNAADVYPMWFIQFSRGDAPPEMTHIGTDEFILRAQRGFDKQCVKSSGASPAESNSALRRAPPTDADKRDAVRAMRQLRAGTSGGLSKAALRSQPRCIKELLTRVAADTYDRRRER